MKKILVIFSLCFLLFGIILSSPIILAQETQQNPGITPDSFLWGLDKALEQISLLSLTSPNAKATKGLEHAEERLAEIKIMIEENKLDAAEKAEESHGETLVKVKQKLGEIEEDDSVEELEEIIKIEKKVDEHEQEIEQISGELKIKIKIKGELTEEQQDLIDSILDSLEGQTGEVEIEIKNKKDKTKIKIKIETGRDGEEVEIEIKDEIGLSNFEKERAEKMLKKANDKWDDVIEKAAKFNVNIPDKSGFDSLIAQGDTSLGEGRNEKAKDLYEEAKDLAEELKEEIERAGGEDEEEDELEIEVEIENGMAEVEVELNGDEFEFSLETTDRDEIIDEIIERTGLTREQINAVIEFDIEDEDEENKTIDKITVELTEENDSGESGKARLVEENNQVTVTISIDDSPEDVSQPAHIHLGSCPEVGGVKYPLTNILNGESITTVDVTLDQLKSELPLAINIHKSVDEASVYVSCGNIIFN